MNRSMSRILIRRLCGRPWVRSYSAWLNQARADSDTSLSSNVDVEKLFIDQNVQSLMRDLTGIDLQGKVFKERRTSIAQRSHFALMTDERLQQTMEKMRDEATHFLHFVPVKEPRPDTFQVLSSDPEIAKFDNSKFVFTDITFDATDQDRTVVVREVDGTLRTAMTEEHDRMNRTYYPKENRPVQPPKVFEDPHLTNALEKGEHEFVLDWGCYFYEPDDPQFVKLSRKVFDAILAAGNFDVLHSTRHFGPFVFYLALNGNIPPLLNDFGGQGRISECANLIRLQKTLHPDWRVAIGSGDSDEKIVKDFIKQNSRFANQLKDLKRFLKDGTLKKDRADESAQRGAGAAEGRKKAAVNQRNVGSADGPLGEMSSEYSVKVATGEGEDVPQEDKKPRQQRRPFRGGRFQQKPGKEPK